MTQMCDGCFDKAIAAMACSHQVKSDRQIGDYEHQPIRASAKATKPKARQGDYGSYLNGLVDTKCLSEAKAQRLKLSWSPVNRRAALAREIGEHYPQFAPQQMNEAIDTALAMEGVTQ